MAFNVNWEITDCDGQVRTGTSTDIYDFSDAAYTAGTYDFDSVIDELEGFERLKKIKCSGVADSIMIDWGDVDEDGNYIESWESIFSFYDALEELDLSELDTTNIEDETLYGAFGWNTNLKTLKLGEFNAPNATSIEGLFFRCNSLESLDLSNFNAPNIENMRAAFRGCNVINNLDLSNFDTSKVTNMGSLFAECYALNNLNISNWNTSNVTTMQLMFDVAIDSERNNDAGPTLNTVFRGFETLDLSNFDTSKVTNFMGMFECQNNLKHLNISSFNTSSAETMENMFYGVSLKVIYLPDTFITSNVTNMAKMFKWCKNLRKIYSKSFDTSKVEDSHNMFQNCQALQKLKHYDNMDNITAEFAKQDGYFDNRKCNAYQGIRPLYHH